MSRAHMWQICLIALVMAFGTVVVGDVVPAAYAQVELDPGDGKQSGSGDPDVPNAGKNSYMSVGPLEVEPSDGRRDFRAELDPATPRIERGVSYDDYQLWVRMLSMLMRIRIGWF